MIAELDRIEGRMAEEYELLLMAARQLSFVRERVLRSEKNILLHLNGERRKPEEKLVMIDNEIEKDVLLVLTGGEHRDDNE
jgi:Cft2 family RNA processing exonuclease